MLLRTSNTVGKVTVKVNAAMTAGIDGDTSVPRLRLEAGWRNEQSLRVKNVGEFDITQSLEQPQTVEFTFRIEDVIEPATARGEKGSQHRWILLVLSNVARHPQGLLAASEFGQLDLSVSVNRKEGDAVLGQTKKAIAQQVAGWDHWQEKGVPLLYLDALEAEVMPTNADHQSPWFVKYPGRDASIEQQKDKLKGVLADYLPKVFRKSNISDETYTTYLNLFQKLRQQGDSFERAVRETMAAALISPEFLYIGYSQQQAQDGADQAYANQYLASRLSYYLWSSMPDQILLQLAKQQRLTDPAVLAGQVERMLASPKAKRFTDTFARQWLQLAKLEDVTVSADILSYLWCRTERLNCSSIGVNVPR
ncbi:DUF1592 domain-containing protein [Paraglaciecola aquimarina]|uniref:DUF1592 domain-containing protein n=1 Tax=Paraglaciecola aquimarina TaxID=1235557 RepID=A0ABU3SZI0_9ALTE|nr:DUF1592 domain-containing protein [Paraglaciecola aquimarina]MDU0355413.1 DUF1592 domain-containing protein [Paraglaciecola aquimarina]